jgi:3-dehydrosphinganine reductase
VDPKQILQYFSFALDTAAGAAAAVDAACVSHGGIGPDAMFLCAGACKPGFYFEMDEAKMQQGMKDGYWVQAWSALVRSYFHFFVRRY